MRAADSHRRFMRHAGATPCQPPSKPLTLRRHGRIDDLFDNVSHGVCVCVCVGEGALGGKASTESTKKQSVERKKNTFSSPHPLRGLCNLSPSLLTMRTTLPTAGAGRCAAPARGARLTARAAAGKGKRERIEGSRGVASLLADSCRPRVSPGRGMGARRGAGEAGGRDSRVSRRHSLSRRNRHPKTRTPRPHHNPPPSRCDVQSASRVPGEAGWWGRG